MSEEDKDQVCNYALLENGKTQIKSNEVCHPVTKKPTVKKSSNPPDGKKVKSGDIVTYSFVINNPEDENLSGWVFKDAQYLYVNNDPLVSSGWTYISGTFKVNGAVTAPTGTDPIVYPIEPLKPGDTKIEFQVLVA